MLHRSKINKGKITLGVITLLTLVFIFSIHPGIAMLVVCLTPVSLLVARFIATHTYDMFRLQSETRGEQTALAEEMIEGEKDDFFTFDFSYGSRNKAAEDCRNRGRGFACLGVHHRVRERLP